MRRKTMPTLSVAAVSTLVLMAWTGAQAGPPKGWMLAGSEPEAYESGLDSSESWTGQSSAYLASRGAPDGFGTVMQMVAPDDYRGQRVRLQGYVKSAEVEDWAGLWLRVDGPGRDSLAFDNMQERAVRGTTDWRRYEIVLDVPREATKLAFGFLVTGRGRIWVDALELDVVDDDTPTTDMLSTNQSGPKEGE